MRRLIAYGIVLLILIVPWWALSASGTVAPLTLPPLPSVGSALRSLLASAGDWLPDVALTVWRALAGFGIAAIAGVPLGVALGRSRLLGRAYEPLLGTLAAVPLVVLYPVLAATLGIGTWSKVVLGGLYAFFPIVIGTTRAVAQTDPGLVTAMRAMGAGRGRLAWTVVVPSALPGMVSGLRAGLGLALVTVIAAEFIAGDAGVGYRLAAAGQGYRSADLFAWVALAVVLTVLVNAAFTVFASLLERSVRR
ncbi:ABC transporter permease [Actinoplanes sp. CA-142083]|uniref:ABC transporter permease n=1 Tax=Actinoplanes sp. CA-142083 TaxID=3239903 RepID=UPI003D8B7BDE